MDPNRRNRSSRAWNAALWIAQVLLAALFGMAGLMKAFTPIPELAETLPWVASVPTLTRFIGVAELAGALGLILPAATRIRPWLTPLAAIGLLVIMVLAAGFHLSRGELSALPLNVALGGLAAFVVWGRTRKAIIRPR